MASNRRSLKKLPDSAFFQRNGHRVVEQERYILDLRDGSARKHLDDVIDRLVNDYGIGYFKMDYNVSPGSGTDYQPIQLVTACLNITGPI